MIEFFFASFFGIVCGFFSGLIPGIHVNTICAILLSVFVSSFTISPELIIVFIASLAVTHTFFDVLPGLFLGIPGDSTFALLPGHDLVKKGYGSLAIKLSIIGSLSGLFLGIIIFTFLSQENAMAMDNFIKPYLLYVLIIVSIILVLSERNPLSALFVFLASGLLGILVSASPIIYPREAPINSMLPSLTGLFALSGLIWSITTLVGSKTSNNDKNQIINFSEIPAPSIRGGIAGFIVGILPGLGGANAATILLLIENWIGKSKGRDYENRSYLVTTSSLNTTEAMISIITLYLISKPRSGASIAIQTILEGKILINHVQIIIISMIFAGLISAIAMWRFGPIIAKKIDLFDYGALNWSLIFFLISLVSSLLDLGGLTILLCSFAIGILPFVLNVRKGQLMGFFLIPVIIYYSGGGRILYDTLKLSQKHPIVFEYPSINTVFISILFSTLVCIFSYIIIKKANIDIIIHKKIASKLIIIFPLIGIFLLFLNLYINNY